MGINLNDIELQNSLIGAINEASPEGMLVVDANGIVVSHNHRFVEIWRIPDELLGGAIPGTAIGADFTSILDDIIPRLVDSATFLERVGRLKESTDLTEHCEVVLRDGRTVAGLSTTLHSKDGRYLGRVWFFRDVTADRVAEEKLQVTQFISDQAPDSIMWVDDRARIVYVNQASCHEYGYSKDELLGKSIFDLNPGANPEKWPAHWKRLQDQRTLKFETSHKRKDGSIFTVEVSANYIKFAGRELNVAFLRDITERKQQQLLLEASRERFEKLFEYSSDGMFILDMHGNFLDVNRTAYESLGYTKNELMSMKLSELDPPEFAARVPERIQQIKEHGIAVFETAHYRKDGSIMPVEIKARVIELGGEKVLFSIIRDISERKKAETELLIAAVAFESQEMLVITDANGVILRVNQAFVDNTGYTAEEAIGNTPRILKSGRHDEAFYREMWSTLKLTGTWQGEVWDRRKNGEIYPKWLTISAVKGRDGVVTHYVGSHIDITERKAAEEKIQHLAFYDPLTHLPNRRLLMDRLQQAMLSSARSHQKAALLFIDLDHFKTLNDTQGHDVGDMLLQHVSKRLEACVREGDTVARLGGDEFMLILEGLSKHSREAAAQAENIGEKILLSLSQPYRLGTLEFHSTPSIGVTIFDGYQLTIDELIKQADIAMYQSKKAGRDTMRFFDPKMQDVISERAALERELRLAIEQGQFLLHYQIQVDSTGRRLGVEALIRWMHPERGMISPAQFIPLAEETGLILEIGQWVLETACAQLKAWQEDPLTRGLVMSVNVSARRFHQAEFVDQVRAAIAHHAVDPKLVKLELTESMLLEDISDTVATMKSLSDIGVSLALDDFGTGYSSLQYLKLLPLDQLKIDQSFVRDLVTDSNDKAIVKTIIAMAQSMDLDVIAEGVETEEQRQILLAMGCEHFQGYLFARPVPIEQLMELLVKGKVS